MRPDPSAPRSGLRVGDLLANTGRRWTIVGVLALGLVAYLLIGGTASDQGCGDSPPYLSSDARLCFVIGYDGPMDNQNLLPLLDAPLDEARELAEAEGWTLYVKRRSDGLDPDVVDEGMDEDRLGVELDGDRVVRIWPG